MNPVVTLIIIAKDSNTIWTIGAHSETHQRLRRGEQSGELLGTVGRIKRVWLSRGDEGRGRENRVCDTGIEERRMS